MSINKTNGLSRLKNGSRIRTVEIWHMAFTNPELRRFNISAREARLDCSTHESLIEHARELDRTDDSVAGRASNVLCITIL